MLRQLKLKDKSTFFIFADNHNIDRKLFFDFIKLRKLAFISEETDLIDGLIFVDGNLKIVSDSSKIANNLLKIFFWTWKKQISTKVNENNKLVYTLKSNGFKILRKEDSNLILSYNPSDRGRKYGNRDHSKYHRNNQRTNKRPA